MEVISNTEFGGERPLFESHNLRLENVVLTCRGVNIFFPFLQPLPCSSVFSSGFIPIHLDNRFPADAGIKSGP